jgi:hypothetical protein
LGVTERFQGFDSKTRQLPASTTLGYKNDGIWAKKKREKIFCGGVVEMAWFRVFGMTRSVIGGSDR